MNFRDRVEITRKTLFECDTLTIGLVETRPMSEACGDIEWQDSNAVAAGVEGGQRPARGFTQPSRAAQPTPTHVVTGLDPVIRG
jgi:hypothetical protein